MRERSKGESLAKTCSGSAAEIVGERNSEEEREGELKSDNKR